MHNLILEIQRKTRNWALIFWILVFPLILTVLFRLIIANAYTTASSPAQVGTLSLNNDPQLAAVLDQLETEGIITLVEPEQADAVLEVQDDGQLVVHMDDNGIAQTIITAIANQYQQTRALTEQTGILPDNSQTAYLVEKTMPSNKSLIYINYFTTLAMGCLSSAYFGLKAINDLQANLSEVGKRLACSPEKKSHLVFKQVLSNNLICMSLNLIQILVMKYLLQIDFGTHTGFILLTTFLGSWLGNGLGMVVGGFLKLNYNDKSNLLTAIIMLGNTAAGMMLPQIKYLVRLYCPLADALNPAALITDAYYQLSFYGLNATYYRLIITMAVIGLLFYLLTLLILRRQRYASL